MSPSRASQAPPHLPSCARASHHSFSLACLHTCRVIVSLSYANVCHCLYMYVRHAVVFSLAFVACTLQRQQQQQQAEQQELQPQLQLLNLRTHRTSLNRI